MQETEVIYEVLAASHPLTLAVWALNYFGCYGEKLWYIALCNSTYKAQWQKVATDSTPRRGSTRLGLGIWAKQLDCS